MRGNAHSATVTFAQVNSARPGIRTFGGDVSSVTTGNKGSRSTRVMFQCAVVLRQRCTLLGLSGIGG